MFRPTVFSHESIKLQWGRDQLIAEIRARAGIRMRGFEKLQWGRDQLIAEMFTSVVLAPSPGKLQWGRDQLIAEMGSLAEVKALQGKCFNGAAIN